MLSCDICGGPRMNGTPITSTEDGWIVGEYPRNRFTKYCCRDCAKNEVHGE